MKKFFLPLILLATITTFSMRPAELAPELSTPTIRLDDLSTELGKPIASVGSSFYVLTDVEGKWDRVQEFIDKAGIFDLSDSVNVKLKDPNTKFVFDGDALDHGPSSKKILEFLLSAKLNNPDQVTLILGNREINKLRLIRELLPEALILDGSDGTDMFSADRFRIPSWKAHFDTWSKDPKLATVDGDFVEYKHGKAPETDKILKLKWIFAATMGAANAFDNFKKEIGAKSDSDTYNAYMDMLKPNGLLAQYLRNAQIIHFDKATGTAFAHGGIGKTNIGYVPETAQGKGDKQTLPITNNAEFQAWVDQLNAWGQKLTQKAFDPTQAIGESLPLIQYQEPEIVVVDGKPTWNGNVPNPISVVQNRPIENYELVQIDDATAQQLFNAGVSKVVFGHSPVGQVPVILKSNDGSFVRVASDTSAAANPSPVIKVTGDGVAVSATYIKPNKTQVPVDYRSQEAIVGTQTDVKGKPGWHISEKLKASWSQGTTPDGKLLPFSAATYELAE